ncbi:MAG: AmmeMemoRadiSam system protein A [Clostridiales Family XIII bacterium]|jgi:AmmeMemoRadiSam system protein A|nr:AmmeMemoRadiSam system protein A [Clostridiales Family XIII bacterium]
MAENHAPAKGASADNPSGNGNGNVNVIESARAFLLPHPPLIVPGIGNGDEIPSTRAAMERVASEVADMNPETIVYITPHSCVYGDYIHISPGTKASGDLGQFRARNVKFSAEYDEELASLIGEISSADGLPAGPLGERDASLDHGVLVPMYFIGGAGAGAAKIVRISLSGFSLADHYRFGSYVSEAVNRLGRRAVLIASGDMSHRLKEDGPYGFAPEGPAHDEYVKSCLETSDMRGLLAIEPSVRKGAGECGLASVVVAAGYLDGREVKSEVYSYEGPYGVGYLVAALTGGDEAPSLLPGILSDREAAITRTREAEDPYVRLARANVERYVTTGRGMTAAYVSGSDEWPDELFTDHAGVFVSIKKDGELRGCIGTTVPTMDSIAAEILSNSVSAAARDPRFEPIDESELDSLTYSVDVLAAPEKIDGPDGLDVKRYGVIVSRGGRRGLLLPDLDGVDTPEQQIDIARRKGGIGKGEPCSLERFEVVRHR